MRVDNSIYIIRRMMSYGETQVRLGSAADDMPRPAFLDIKFPFAKFPVR
jgi:hypothetical protein